MVVVESRGVTIQMCKPLHLLVCCEWWGRMAWARFVLKHASIKHRCGFYTMLCELSSATEHVRSLLAVVFAVFKQKSVLSFSA